MEGQIVGIVHQQNQIIALQIQRIRHALKELLHRLIHLQRGVFQRGEQRVLIAVQHLIRTERDIDQIFARRAGDGSFEYG